MLLIAGLIRWAMAPFGNQTFISILILNETMLTIKTNKSLIILMFLTSRGGPSNYKEKNETQQLPVNFFAMKMRKHESADSANI